MNILSGGIGRAFASRNYRIFWGAHLATILGVWVNRIAVQWVTWELTHSFAWLGIIGAANMVPTLVFGLVAGVTADRYGHRLQLQIATAAGGVVALILAILVMTDLITVELMLVLVIGSGISRAFNVAARGALVHAVVPKDLLSAAIGVSSATYHSGNFFGIVLGGAIIATIGAGAALITYVIGSMISVFLMALLKIDESQWQDKPAKKLDILGDLREGFTYTMNHRGIRVLMLLSAIVALFFQPYLELLAGIADDVFNRREDGFVILASATGLGAMLGGLILAQRGRTEGLTRIFIGAVFAAGIGIVGFALADSFWWALPPLFLIGAALVAAQTAAQSLTQNAVEQSVRARVFSINAVIGVGFPALGAILIGTLASQLGAQLPLLGAGILGLCLWLLSIRPVFRQAKTLETTD